MLSKIQFDPSPLGYGRFFKNVPRIFKDTLLLSVKLKIVLHNETIHYKKATFISFISKQ